MNNSTLRGNFKIFFLGCHACGCQDIEDEAHVTQQELEDHPIAVNHFKEAYKPSEDTTVYATATPTSAPR